MDVCTRVCVASMSVNPLVHLLTLPHHMPLLTYQSQVFDRMAAVATGVKHRSLPLLIYMGSFSTLSCALSALKPTDPTVRVCLGSRIS